MKLLGTSNEANRVAWVQQALAGLPAGSRLLDAGAGEQPFRKCCAHLNYVSQDFAEYDPRSDPTGLQMSGWDYGRLDIVSDLRGYRSPTVRSTRSCARKCSNTFPTRSPRSASSPACCDPAGN